MISEILRMTELKYLLNNSSLFQSPSMTLEKFPFDFAFWNDLIPK